MKALYAILFLILLTPSAGVNAQEAKQICKTNLNAPPIGAYFWSPDAPVKVYFATGAFTTEQRKALLETMETWTRDGKSAGTGIRFSYAGESNGLDTCQNCLTLTRGEVHKTDRRHYAQFMPLRWNGTFLGSAWIELDFAIINPKALQGFIAHELAHSVGLGDCPTCKSRRTIMNSFPSINRDNGLISASSCDLEVVRQLYGEQRRISQTRTPREKVVVAPAR